MSRKQEQGSLSLRGSGSLQCLPAPSTHRVGKMGFTRGINYAGSRGLKRVASKHKDHAHRLRAKKAPVPKSNCRDACTAQS